MVRANGQNEIRIMPYGQKNLLMLKTWNLAWELWFASRLHIFYFKTLSQSKGSYQLLMKFMLFKSQLSSKTCLGKYRTFSRHFGQFLCPIWTSFLLIDPKFKYQILLWCEWIPFSTQNILSSSDMIFIFPNIEGFRRTKLSQSGPKWL